MAHAGSTQQGAKSENTDLYCCSPDNFPQPSSVSRKSADSDSAAPYSGTTEVEECSGGRSGGFLRRSFEYVYGSSKHDYTNESAQKEDDSRSGKARPPNPLKSLKSFVTGKSRGPTSSTSELQQSSVAGSSQIVALTDSPPQSSSIIEMKEKTYPHASIDTSLGGGGVRPDAGGGCIVHRPLTEAIQATGTVPTKSTSRAESTSNYVSSITITAHSSCPTDSMGNKVNSGNIQSTLCVTRTSSDQASGASFVSCQSTPSEVDSLNLFAHAAGAYAITREFLHEDTIHADPKSVLKRPSGATGGSKVKKQVTIEENAQVLGATNICNMTVKNKHEEDDLSSLTVDPCFDKCSSDSLVEFACSDTMKPSQLAVEGFVEVEIGVDLQEATEKKDLAVIRTDSEESKPDDLVGETPPKNESSVDGTKKKKVPTATLR